MAHFTTPTMKWPFALNKGATTFQFVEQDTVEEITQCVALVLTARPGEFPDEPDLGTPEPAFHEEGVTEDTLISAVEQWEPRASVEVIDDVLEGVKQTVKIGVEGA